MIQQMGRGAAAGARAGTRHQLDVMLALGRVVSAVIAPVAEERPLALGPARRPLVRGQADKRPLFGPRLVAERDSGRDVVVAVELDRYGHADGQAVGTHRLDLLGRFAAVVAAGT